jgi:hypothetical protein
LIAVLKEHDIPTAVKHLMQLLGAIFALKTNLRVVANNGIVPGRYLQWDEWDFSRVAFQRETPQMRQIYTDFAAFLSKSDLSTIYLQFSGQVLRVLA